MDANLTDNELGFELTQDGSFFVAVGMFMGYLLYALTILLGLPLNLLVLYRITKLSRQFPDLYKNGTGICLFSMAISDLFSLAAICVHYVLSFELSLSPLVHRFVCKVAIFTLHCSTSISIWSWLIMSFVRYLSIYHSLFHYRLWRLPARTLFFVIAVAVITNLPLLFMVDFDASEGCTQVPLSVGFPQLNRIFLFVETVWSFCLPSSIILFVDSSVYLCRRRANLGSTFLTKNNPIPRQQSNRKMRKALWHWLTIALIDVLLNAPENIYRLLIILGLLDPNTHGNEAYLFGRMFAQVLYYSQFSFNTLYLALFIYDKSVRFHTGNPKNRLLNTSTGSGFMHRSSNNNLNHETLPNSVR